MIRNDTIVMKENKFKETHNYMFQQVTHFKSLIKIYSIINMTIMSSKKNKHVLPLNVMQAS